MKIFSFLVLVIAFLGNENSTAFVSTIQVLNNLEQTAHLEEEISEVEEKSLTLPLAVSSRPISYKRTQLSSPVSHVNFTLDQLTFYYTSRLKI